MSKKTTKPSIKEKKPLQTRDRVSKESPWLEDYLDCFSFGYKPVTQMFLERISQELITWARKETKQYKIAPFFDEKHIAYNTYTNWAKKYPENFGAAYQLAKSILGTRREYGALERKLDAGTVISMMPHYDSEWREMIDYRNELKAKSNEKINTGTQYIVMEKFASSDKVPLKPNRTEEPKETPEQVANKSSMKSREYKRVK